MQHRTPEGHLAEWREQYLRLLDEARKLLGNLDTLGVTGLAEAVQRRQEIVELLQNFDRRFSEDCRAELPAEFRAFMEETTEKILEIDRLVMAWARDKQGAIKEQLAAHARSKSVSRAYGTGRGSIGPSWLSDTL
jgi:hypothetical protein